LAHRFYQSETGGASFAKALASSRSLNLGLLHAAGEAMQELSVATTTEIALDHGAGFGHDLYTRLARSEFEVTLEEGLLKIGELCLRAMREAHLQPHQIDAVVLAGGASQIPAVRRVVALTLARQPEELICYEPQGLAALGAAVQAAALSGYSSFEHLRVRDITPYPLGIAAYFATGDGLTEENGEEELLSVIVDRQAGLPIRRQTTYYTRRPNQTQMELHLLQYRGERQPTSRGYLPKVYPHECETLGKWLLTGILPRQKSEVLVTFEIDENGILHLTAEEKGTSNRLNQQITRW